MAKNIQPVQIWTSGEVKTASVFNLRSIGDDLETSAQFYWEMKEADSQDADGNTISGSVLANGNLSMSGQTYEDWGNQSGVDINAWAYDWAAGQLNITII